MRFSPLGRRISALSISVIIASAGAISPAASASVSSSGLRALFPGTFAANASGIPVTLIATANGRLTGRSIIGSDTGRWSVQGSKLCIMLKDWFDGDTRCSGVVRDGKWYHADGVSFRKI